VGLEFETVIGLEMHAQVLTRSKMYCSCAAAYADAAPNTHVCPVCLGMPGVLPVINRVAIEKTILTGLAFGCDIPSANKFDRKNYMYPDLPKGYQVSQYDLPIAVSGQLEFEVDGRAVRCGITRVHLEEDTARLTHRADAQGDRSLIDMNRSGVPLMEIVGEPDLRSPAEAREFLIAVRRILRYIGASTGNMEEGAFRCDANVSQRTTDGKLVGPKVEIKNLNSFRAVERALEFEVERQRAALTAGESLTQETRGWVDERGVTVGQRSKEMAHDYRYFPEPDLPPVTVGQAWVAELRERLPELPIARRERLVADYGLGRSDAALITDEAAIADFYEQSVAAAGGHHREIANWLTGEVFALAKGAGGFERAPVTPEQLAEVATMVSAGEINALTGKDVLSVASTTGGSPRQIVAERGLGQINDETQLREVVARVIADNPKAIDDFRAGKQAAIGFLIGAAMRQLRGVGNPDTVRRILTETLTDDT
jgi:aspartyl-tRNA(Asn)/glutamyl-tRNA(Gln) amidotransferase subunit B